MAFLMKQVILSRSLSLMQAKGHQIGILLGQHILSSCLPISDSIRSILVLAKLRKYRDCFIILRTVFEYYFLLLLMIKGKKYRDTKTYHITPTVSKTREARDLTYREMGNGLEIWKTRISEVKSNQQRAC